MIRTLRSALRSTALVVGLLAAAAVHAQDRAIFQVTEADPAKWNLVLNNVRNLQKDVEGVDVEVVAYGPGVQLLRAGSPVAERITEAVGNKVRVVACENTMAGAHLTKPEMLPEIGYVPSGVVEVMRKQQAGYAYIRP